MIERVTFELDPHDVSRCIPRVHSEEIAIKGGAETIRDFTSEDMGRVLDFDVMPDSPPDSSLRRCEREANFPFRHLCLRGQFVFYFEEKSVQSNGSGVETTYTKPPLGVIPLERTSVEFPPGGRRVFQDHAKTEANKGYEFAIRHTPREGDESRRRMDEYLVADTMGERESWAAAIRVRAELIKRSTTLRTGGGAATGGGVGAPGGKGGAAFGGGGADVGGFAKDKKKSEERPEDAGGGVDGDVEGPVDGMGGEAGSLPPPSAEEIALAAAKARIAASRRMLDTLMGEPTNSLSAISEDTASLMQNDLIKQFTHPRFRDVDWASDFFVTHSEYESEATVQKLESTQVAVKRGLRGAVLEQYKYFVEASREMTTMGREVHALRRLVTGQQECIESMKGINFADAFADPVLEGEDEDGYYSSSSEEEEEDEVEGVVDADDDDDDDDESDDSSHSSFDELTPKKAQVRGGMAAPRSTMKTSKFAPDEKAKGDGGVGGDSGPILIEIPPWLEDATEEIASFIKECRFTEATDMILKTRAEVFDILNQHDKPTERKLSKKQHTQMQRTLMEVEKLTDLMGDRLAETLRRKNEALKVACKRERSDPKNFMAPLLSPICLSDDATALQLLVKLGRSKDAADAYSTRRSLQLSESLNERSMASSSSVTSDVDIYAAQLSQSFFSCLAMAVEGFLDLYLGGDSLTAASSVGGGPGARGGGGGLGDPLEENSIHSAANKQVPAGAVASIVLWCDMELAKFAHTFGGSRVLGRLNLAPTTTPSLSSNASIGGATVTTVASSDVSSMNDGQTVASSSSSKRGDTSSVVGDAAANNVKMYREQISDLKKKLRAAEEAADYSLAASLRRKLTAAEESLRKSEKAARAAASSVSTKGSRGSSKNNSKGGAAADKGDRQQLGVEVGARCVEHAFHFASESLDSIGLPLTPRLAEVIRPRLKGCETEIASLLGKRWHHIVADWHIPREPSSMSPGRRSRRKRAAAVGLNGGKTNGLR